MGLMGLMLWLGMVPGAVAADDPATREYRRQQERQEQLRKAQEPSPDVRLPRGAAAEDVSFPAEESPCFHIENIRLQGELAEDFQWALRFAHLRTDGRQDLQLPRCLGGQSINLILRRMQNAIIARGYVTTRVLAVPQDLKTGQLTLALVPGRIGAIVPADDADPKLTYWNAVPARRGDLLNLRDLEQGLENFKRVPTADADFQLRPSTGTEARPGDSDLVVSWKQRFPARASFALDDAGSETTGKYQGNATLSLDHWLSLNDMFYFSYNQDLGGGEGGERGTRGHALHYSFPFGYWLFAVTDAENRYHQAVAGASQTYEYSGESSNSELRLSRLVYRDAVRKTTLGLRGWTRASRNFIDDTEVLVQRRRMAGWAFNASHSENLGAAVLETELGYRRGTGAEGALPAPEEPFGEGTSRPEIITLDGHWRWPFRLGEQVLRAGSEVRVQWNLTPLVPQDRFAIGSRYTVRGFDGETLLSADRGWLIRNELGWQPWQAGQEWYVGVDYGEVSGSSSAYLLGKALTGAVMGMRGGWRWVNYDIFTGTPLHKPDGFTTDSVASGFSASVSF